jgi:hypothetical protein
MSLENMTCFGCGGKGHVERECPSNVIVGGQPDKPLWCGTCDRRTRLIEIHGLASRCPQCHPLSHQNLAQHIRCPGCRVIVYSWDNNPCGKHSSPVKPSDSRPPREEIDSIVAREMAAEERCDEVARGFAEHPRDDAGTAA